MDQKESVRDQFGPAAPHYAVAAVHAAGPDLSAMLGALPLRGDERILDVGCGAGHTALAFAARVAEVHALDLTPAMLEQVRALAEQRGLSNVTCRQGDAECLPYPDGHFDAVTVRLCAHHFRQPERAVAEMARVLRPGGDLLLSDSVSPEAPAQDTFLNAIELLRDPSHVRNYTLSQWRRMLAREGLAIRAIDQWPTVLDFDDWVARQATEPAAVEMLRRMLRGAHAENRREFVVEGEGPRTWTIRIAFIHAHKSEPPV